MTYGGRSPCRTSTRAAAVQALEACIVAGRASVARALDSARSSIPDRMLPDVVDGLFAGTNRRCSLSLA